MTLKKRIQLFIHRYYDVIKLAILIFVAIMAVVIIINQIRENERQTEEIKQNARHNTIILCTLIIGQQDIHLTDEDRGEIERVCQEEVDRASQQPQPVAAEPAPLQPSRPQPSSLPSEPSSSSNNTPSPKPAQPDNSQSEEDVEEEPTEPSGVLRFIPGVKDEPILGCPLEIICL